MGGFPGRATSHSSLRAHFVHCHMQDRVVILEEVIYPLPRCPKCDMFVTWRVRNGRHQAIEMCARGEERGRK